MYLKHLALLLSQVSFQKGLLQNKTKKQRRKNWRFAEVVQSNHVSIKLPIEAKGKTSFQSQLTSRVVCLSITTGMIGKELSSSMNSFLLPMVESLARKKCTQKIIFNFKHYVVYNSKWLSLHLHRTEYALNSGKEYSNYKPNRYIFKIKNSVQNH